MGLFSKLKGSPVPDISESAQQPTEDAAAARSEEQPRKKSLYARYQEKKRGPGLANMTDEELEKYTGMTRVEFDKWAATTPGVAGGQAAGSVTAGGNSGLGGAAAADGLGGWGFEAGKRPTER